MHEKDISNIKMMCLILCVGIPAPLFWHHEAEFRSCGLESKAHLNQGCHVDAQMDYVNILSSSLEFNHSATFFMEGGCLVSSNVKV